MKSIDYITFRKERELGQIVGDTFKFLRKNAKAIFSVFVRVALVPFIFLIGAVAYYTYEVGGANPLLDMMQGSSGLGGVIISVLLLFVAVTIYNGILYGMIAEFIKNYIDTTGTPSEDTIVQNTKDKMSQYILLSFSQTLAMAGIAIACFIPVGFVISSSMALGVLLGIAAIMPIIYFAVQWTVLFPAMANDNLTISAAFSESVRLIKEHWWITFFTIIIQAILMYVIGIVFQLPVIFYTVIRAFTVIQENNFSDPSQMFDGVYVALQTLASAASYVLYIIMAITINLIYFNLHERKTQRGSLDAIDNIGQ